MKTNTTTTANFQQKFDYYTSKDDCMISTRERIQTNARYKNFNQTHFTAGDVEQFADYCYDKNGKLFKEEISLNDNLFKSHNFEIWKGNENLEAPDIQNTFYYIFNKFKKGIFVKIMDNKLKVFLPFSNANFCNEWSDKIRHSNNDIFKYVCGVEGKVQFNEKHINEHKNTWFANNSLIRYEFPLNEGDTNVSNVKNMLDELCEKRKVPDIEFFLNRRDFPILTKNYCEPYYDLWGGTKHELVSHKYEKYAPILSMSKTSNFADILIPIHEDWSRIQSKENKWFPRSFRSCDNDDTFSVNWEDKKEIAVFRGTSTGAGVTIETNQRLKLAYLSTLRKRDPNDNLLYLDAGITKWNVRPRKLANSPDLQSIDINKLPFKLVDSLNYKQFSEYKYIIHCSGNVAAFRLGSELSMGSVILLVNSEWKLWFSHMIKPYEHYVPIKEDLSDLIHQIKWCKKNDAKCKLISQNARKFYDTYLQKNGVLDYLQKMLVDLKDKIGIYKYNDIKPLDIQLEYQKEFISRFMIKYPKTKKKIKDINELPLNIKRNNGLLKGIHYLINMINDQDSLEKIFFDDEKMSVIFTNKTVTVKKYDFLGFPLVIKETTNEKKIKENYHEAFIGLTCINKLLKNIPNFCYTYGIYKDNVISEHLSGMSLFDYIKSDKFDFKEYVFILLQICIVLHVAQRECCLVHYDLTSWNIILQHHDTPVEIEYVLNYDKVIKFHTSVVPIIIDYGKSHVVYENTHYGFVNMYKFSTSQDILSLLITSIYQILVDQNINKADFINLLKIANFLSGTKYRKSPFTNSRELKNFLYSAKKYSELLLSDKFELESKTPMDLFEYLNKNLKYKFKIDISTKYNSFMNKSSPEQIFEFILSNSQMDKINSYINALQKVKTYNYNDQCSDDILTFYKLQNLLDDFNNTVIDLNDFAEKTPSLNKSKFKNITKELLKILKDKCKMYNDFEREELTFLTSSLNENVDNSFNESTFLLPKKLKEIIDSYKNINLDESIRSIMYRDIIESMILNPCFNKFFSIDKQYFIDSYKDLLKLNPYIIKNNIANVFTINNVTEKLNIIESEEQKNRQEEFRKTEDDEDDKTDKETEHEIDEETEDEIEEEY